MRPNLTIDVEPQESGKAVFLRIAPMSAGKKELAKVVLRLLMTNHHERALKIEEIKFSFPDSDTPAVSMRAVAAYLIQKRQSAEIEALGTVEWSNGIVPIGPESPETVLEEVDNRIFLVAPAPAKVLVSVRCADFDQPATITLPLAAFTRPTPAGAFLFPFSADDLRPNEFFVTSAKHWSSGGLGGTQIFAHDIGVDGWELLSPVGSNLLPGRVGARNEDYRIWGKPIRAVADGKVEEFLEDTADNRILGQFPDPAPDSNFIAIRHHHEVVLYKHLKKGTIPTHLKRNGADVTAGEIIGRVGNNGRSSHPHLHLECRHDSPSGVLRPMPFRNAWVVDRSIFPPPNANSPWVELHGQGISKDPVAIWPSAKKP